MSHADESEILQQQIVAADNPQALGELMLRYQDRLERVVGFRMDARLRSRIDPADVIQESFAEATQRIEDYRKCADRTSFFLWLRFLTLQKLNQMYRHHVGVQARDATRERTLDQAPVGKATSMILAAQLLGKLTTPSRAAMRAEDQRRLAEALQQMEPIDREILTLRHFEHLSNGETAELLELSPAAASNRYFRALARLKQMLDQLPGMRRLPGGGLPEGLP